MVEALCERPDAQAVSVADVPSGQVALPEGSGRISLQTQRRSVKSAPMKLVPSIEPSMKLTMTAVLERLASDKVSAVEIGVEEATLGRGWHLQGSRPERSAPVKSPQRRKSRPLRS